MLTGVPELISVHHSVNLGADDYVRKPFNTPILLARIKSKLRCARGKVRHTDDQITNMDLLCSYLRDDVNSLNYQVRCISQKFGVNPCV